MGFAESDNLELGFRHLKCDPPLLAGSGVLLEKYRGRAR